MFGRRSDLPLRTDPATRFLPWLVAVMTFMAALSAAGALMLDDMVGRWESGVAHTLTVQVPPGGDAEADGKRVAEAVKILLAVPGIIHAREIPAREIMKLVEPWLGTSAAVADLPLPRLIDVTIDENSGIDTRALSERLQAAVPGTLLDDHGLWLQRLVRLVRSLEVLAWAVVGLVGLVTAATVIFTTRAGLAVHREVIEVLHLIGAQDSYIAGQFAHHAANLGFRGGLIGVILAGPALLAIGALSSRLQSTLLPRLVLANWHWSVLALLPVLAWLLAWLTARLTVGRALRRIL